MKDIAECITMLAVAFISLIITYSFFAQTLSELVTVAFEPLAGRTK